MTRDEADAVRGVLLCWWMDVTGVWNGLLSLDSSASVVGDACRACFAANPSSDAFTRVGIERALAHFDEVNP